MNNISHQVAARIEELLREQLEELGVNVRTIAPHEITEGMRCEVHPDESMVYSWHGTRLLRVVPEKDEDGSLIRWRMFTKDDLESPIQ